MTVSGFLIHTAATIALVVVFLVAGFVQMTSNWNEGGGSIWDCWIVLFLVLAIGQWWI